MGGNIPLKNLNLNNAFEFSQRFSIRSVQNLLNGKPMIEQLHRHDFFFMLVLKKGKGKHEIDFVNYNITNYSIYFVRPGQVHKIRLDASSTGYMLNFSREVFHENKKTQSQLLNRVSAQNLYDIQEPLFKKIHLSLKEIFYETSNKNKGYEEVVKAYLCIILNQLDRCIKCTKYQPELKYQQERYEEFIELLNNNIRDKKKVFEYAELMGISVFQINNITKTVQDKTCSEVIKEHVVLESKRYLLSTSLQVNQVALALGYHDISYFIRLFKKQTGYSPKAFRQNFK